MGGDRESGRFSLGSLLTALPIVVAWVYFVGRSYLESYYLAFGADFTILRPDLNDSLLFGVMGQIGVVVGYLVLIVLLVCLLLAVTFFGHLLSALLRRNWALASHLLKNVFFPRRWTDGRAGSDSSSDFPKPTVTVEATIGAIGALVISVLMAREVGDQAALAKLADWSAAEPDAMMLVKFVEGGTVQAMNGRLIGCGEAACAFWTRQHVFQLPRGSIVSVQTSAPIASDQL